MENKPHVVIIGAGFGGVGALRKLKDAPVSVTLIDRNDFHTFQPLLYQVATSQLDEAEVGFPAPSLVESRDDCRFVRAGITSIDTDARLVHLEGMDPISYDYLVVGLGAVVNFFGTKGAVEHAFPLYTMEDALKLRAHIASRIEAARQDRGLIEDGALRFAVVGGGATGVEISGALAELLSEQMETNYRDLPAEAVEVHLYELAPGLLMPFKPNLREYAHRALEKRRVQVHLNEGVVEIEPTRVHLKSGGSINAHTLVWAAGLTANPLVQGLGQPLEKGRVVVNPDLSLPAHPEVFVAGDIAMITDTKTQKQLPQLGSVALQSGTHAGENIELLVQGKQTKPFEYTDKGTMATIGRGAAVVEMRSGRTMTGRAAYLAWLGVHLMLLSGGEQKAHTFVDWGWEAINGGKAKHLDEEEDLAA